MNEEKQVIYAPMFIKDLVEDYLSFIKRSSLRIDPERKNLFINPYGYAYPAHEGKAYIEIIKLISGGYDLGQPALDAKVAHVCPKGWHTIPVTVRPYEDYPQDENIVGSQQIADRWDAYGIEEIMEGIVAMTDALERKNVDKIPQLQSIKDIKKYFTKRIQTEQNYIELEPVLSILEDVIADEDKDEGRSRDLTEFYTSLQTIIDTRLAKLMLDPKVKVHEVIPIEEITLAELKQNINKYSEADCTAFVKSLNGDSPQESLDKAAYIRDNVIAH